MNDGTSQLEPRVPLQEETPSQTEDAGLKPTRHVCHSNLQPDVEEVMQTLHVTSAVEPWWTKDILGPACPLIRTRVAPPLISTAGGV